MEKKMLNTKFVCPIHAVRNGLGFLLCSALLAGGVAAQADRSKPDGTPASSINGDIEGAMTRLKQGNFFPADVDLIAKTRGQQAIPDLKKQFELSQNQIPKDPILKLSKDAIASALVRLGDKDPAVWSYLADGAADAIASDAPSALRFDSTGKTIPGPSPEFVAWAKVHHLSTDAALEAEMSELPSKVAFLGEMGDRRAIPLLRQALSSPNFMIEAVAAQGLAELQDKASIPLIIQACREAPGDPAKAIARSLLDFNDPQAQSAAKAFRPLSEPK